MLTMMVKILLVMMIMIMMRMRMMVRKRLKKIIVMMTKMTIKEKVEQYVTIINYDDGKDELVWFHKLVLSHVTTI